jgi:cytosine deaminase
MDLVIRNARLADRATDETSDEFWDIGIERGRITALARSQSGEARGYDGAAYDAGGRLACPGLIETHIHLDKSRIIDRCAPQGGTSARSKASRR